MKKAPGEIAGGFVLSNESVGELMKIPLCFSEIFSVVGDISQNHMATVSKDRTGLFPDTPFIINPKVGEALLHWLNSGNVQDAQKGGEA